MLMLAESTSSSRDYFLQRASKEPLMTPPFRSRHYTPPRLISASPEPSSYDSPMLTPSPLRQRALYSPFNSCTNKLYLQSPYKSSTQPFHHLRPSPIVPDDDEGSIFLSFPPGGDTSSLFQRPSRPLCTPVKELHHVSTLSLRSGQFSSPSVPHQADSYSSLQSGISAGMKRKSAIPLSTTSVCSSDFTTTTLHATSPVMSSLSFPSPGANFVLEVPQAKSEADARLRKQTSTLTRLCIGDSSKPPILDDQLGVMVAGSEHHRAKTSLCPSRSKNSQGTFRTWPGHEFQSANAKGQKEIAEVVSPGGHVIKRRARNRRLSAQLLGVHGSVPQSKRVYGIASPMADVSRKRSSSSSDSGSPLSRRRSDFHRHPPRFSAQLSRSSVKTPESSGSVFRSSNSSVPSSLVKPSRASAISSSTLASTTRTSTNLDSKSTFLYRYTGTPVPNISSQVWNMIQTKEIHSSPDSSPPSCIQLRDRCINKEDLFFRGKKQASSLPRNISGSITLASSKPDVSETLPKKYKPRDSGVVIPSDDDEGYEDDSFLYGNNSAPLFSTLSSFSHSTQTDGGSVEDKFILCALHAASRGPSRGEKRIPGTPVKRLKTQYLTGGARPWQSDIAEKVGLRGKVPRKSLPAAFPALGKKPLNLKSNQNINDIGDGGDKYGGGGDKYFNLGLGLPSNAISQDRPNSRDRWLARRSSSGTFSSESESISSSGTPTRTKNRNLYSITACNVRSLSSMTFDTIEKPTSSSFQHSHKHNVLQSTAHKLTSKIQFSPGGQIGRFQHDFLIEDELGSGEFGKVIKVRRKVDEHQLYAVKKSKRFEGPRHRLRLREEVEILRHLSSIASRTDYERNCHPNVLSYIDSWEEEEVLFIQTELCECGNFARFLWEFGRSFYKLDEGRVWKVIAELSSGLRFIHDAGIIHLDLKPSNIFITSYGQFKIGDFGMASLWPRPKLTNMTFGGGFEREGDKLYLAPEVLQGRYGKEADIFSFGMTILETASNIVVPDQGEAWHRLRREDFSQVNLDCSPELLQIIEQMMRTEPYMRIDVHAVFDHPVVGRARAIMNHLHLAAKQSEISQFAASPLGSICEGFLEQILGIEGTEVASV